MDELEWLKAKSPSTRPSRDVTRRHRTQLRAAIAAEGADGARPRRPRRARPSRVRVLRTGAIVVAACAIGAGVIVLTSSGGGDHAVDVGAPVSSSSPTSTSTAPACGPVPKQLEIPAGFGPAVDGAAAQSLTPPASGQQVTHWSSSDTSIEQRWPASADVAKQFGAGPGASADSGISAAAQPTSTVDEQGIARRTVVFSFGGQPAACSTLQVTVLGRDQAAVDGAVDGIVRKPFVASEPLVTTTGAAASAPAVVACESAAKAGASDAATPAAATVGGPVVEAASFGAPQEALAGFLAHHPTLLSSGYQQLTLDDSSVAFVKDVRPGVPVTTITVRATASGWTVTQWQASGC